MCLSRKLLVQREGVGSDLDPFDLQNPLRAMSRATTYALNTPPNNRNRSGRPTYDDSRDTPLLAAVAETWFEQFPDGEGVRRNGTYANQGCQEYSGGLLNFAVAIFEALSINMGSAGGDRRPLG
jgi:hypothetical protein